MGIGANPTDGELVRQSLQEQEAFGQIIERYSPVLLRYVQRFSGLSRDDAEDVLQEAFIKMYRNLNEFDRDLSFSAWAYRITHNETVNFLRKHRRHATVRLDASDDDSQGLIAILESKTDVMAEVQAKTLAQHVREILGQLPVKYREVLVLRYLEEKDYHEMSDILRKPMGTVATLLNRAKVLFRKQTRKHPARDLTDHL